MNQINIVGFGQRLRQERERMGLTLQDFGLLGDVNRMTQSRYESDMNFPSIDYIHKISQHKVNIPFLLTGASESDFNSLTDIQAVLQASDLVDEIATNHNFVPPPEFRAKAVLQIYLQIRKFGVKNVKPRMVDLLASSSESS